MSLSAFLNSCTVKPSDVPICRALKGKWITTYDAFGIPSTTLRANPVCAKEIKEKQCGYCTWSISDKRQYVGEAKETWLYGKPWSVVRAEAITVPSESYARIKADIVKFCKKTNCDKEVSKWRVKLDSLDSIGQAGTL